MKRLYFLIRYILYIPFSDEDVCVLRKKTLEKKSGFLNFILFFSPEITHYYLLLLPHHQRENTTTDILNAVLETKRAVRG